MCFGSGWRSQEATIMSLNFCHDSGISGQRVGRGIVWTAADSTEGLVLIYRLLDRFSRLGGGNRMLCAWVIKWWRKFLVNYAHGFDNSYLQLCKAKAQPES